MSERFVHRRLLMPLLGLAVLSASSLVFSAAAPLASTWRVTPVTIDGIPSEWPPLAAIDRGPSVALQNDDEFAYVLVSTNDPKWRPLLEGGLVVWVDAKGGKAQTFGIWLPGPAEPAPPGATPTPSAAAGPSGISADVLDQFDLLGPGKNQRRLIDLTAELGIELATAMVGDSVVYELKLPLKKTELRPFAVGVTPGATIGIGLATPETARRSQRRQELVGSSGQVGGYQPGMPGYYPYIPGMGGRGFTPYRDKEDRPKPLLVWTTVAFASNAR